MKLLGVLIQNGFSPEAKVFANLLAQAHGRYDALVLHHAERDPDPKDIGAPDAFARLSSAPLYRFDSGWRRNDDDTRSRSARIFSWARLHAQLPRLLSVASSYRPTAIYSSQQRWDCYVATILASLLRVPQVIHLHYVIGPWLGGVALARLRRAERVIAISEFIRQEAVVHGVPCDRIIVLPNTLRPSQRPSRETHDSLRADLKLPSDAQIITFVARLAPGKGHQDALEAFAAIESSFPSSYLLLVGDGPLGPTLAAQVARLGLSGRVWLLGYRHDVPAILAGSDVFLHPSLNEPFGLSILEAASMSLPTIAYRDSGPAEIVRHGVTGLLSAAGDIEGLAESMCKLLADDELRLMMGAAARRDVEERFDPEKQGARFVEALRTLPPVSR